MRQVAIGFALCVLAIVAVVIWHEWSTKGALALGNFAILALTLIVLAWYAYDINSIARITRERWMREAVLSTTYSMELVGSKGQAGRTLFRIHNPSTLVVRAKVACNFHVYGEPTEADAAYDGRDTWLVFPQQMI